MLHGVHGDLWGHLPALDAHLVLELNPGTLPARKKRWDAEIRNFTCGHFDCRPRPDKGMNPKHVVAHACVGS